MAQLLTPVEIKGAIVSVGEKKAAKSLLELTILGILAGAFISLGAYAANVAVHAMPAGNLGLIKLLQGAIFPVGLLMVLVAGAELFTGNSLMVTGVLDGRISWHGMLRNWVIVYLANFIGSIVFAWLVYRSGLFAQSGGSLGALHVKIAAAKTSLGFTEALIRGGLANFVVCLAVWMAAAAKDVIGKAVASWFPIMAFVVGGFEHSIANMYYIPAGIFAKGSFAAKAGVDVSTLNWHGFFQNLIPVTIGNIIGGAVFVGVAYWIAYKGTSASADSSASKSMKA